MSSIIKGCASCRKIRDVGRNVKERIFSKFSPLVLPLFTPKLTLLALHALFIATYLPTQCLPVKKNKTVLVDYITTFLCLFGHSLNALGISFPHSLSTSFLAYSSALVFRDGDVTNVTFTVELRSICTYFQGVHECVNALVPLF